MEDPLKIYNDILSISNEEGTSDGAKKGWLTRKRGGDGKWEPENWNDGKETKLNEWLDEDLSVDLHKQDIKNMDSTIKSLQDFKESGEQSIDEYDIDGYYDDGYDSVSRFISRYDIDKRIEHIEKQKQKKQEYNDHMENYYSNIIDKEDEIETDLDKEILGFQIGYNGSIDDSLVTDDFSDYYDPSKTNYKDLPEWRIDEMIDDAKMHSRDMIRRWSNKGSKWSTHDQNQYLPQKPKREYAIKAMKKIEKEHEHIKKALQQNLNIVSYLNSLKK